NQKTLKLTSQKAQKQQHEKMKAITGTSTLSTRSDNETESMDAKRPIGCLDMGETSSSQSEVSSDTEEVCDRKVTGIHLELERLRWHFVLAKLKCEQEDKEKQRLHEERMEQIRHQAVKGSVSEGLQNILQPSNQYALFLYCFIIFHVIYTVKELVFYVFQTHYLFCFATVFYILKMIFQDYRNNNKCS
ncbi:transmembrane protein 247, partial [Pezoporus occidentalis]|uniref:transmembrane protein 247 n=1 Tax=Pezoporus occidentalis TaxID=407982 RepID=UPI002F912073